MLPLFKKLASRFALSSLLACSLTVGADSVFQQAENIIVRNGEAQLSRQVDLLFKDDFSAPSDKWEPWKNFEGVLNIEYGEMQGTKGLVITHGPKKGTDTAFEIATKPFDVAEGSEFELKISARGTVDMSLAAGHGTNYLTEIKWFDGEEKPLKPTPFNYKVVSREVRETRIVGRVPAHAKKAIVTFGGDNPNVNPGNYIVYSGFSFESEKQDSPLMESGWFISRPFAMPAAGSTLRWEGTCPEGTSLEFQISTAPNDGGVPGAWSPFVGPDGTAATAFTASGKPLPASAEKQPWLRYRVLFKGLQGKMPSLKRVTIGDIEDSAWTGKDNTAPLVTRLSPAVTSDASAPIQFKITDDTLVDWQKVSLLLDGVDVTPQLTRGNHVITLTPSTPLKTRTGQFEIISDWETLSNYRSGLIIAKLEKEPDVLRVTSDKPLHDTSFRIASPEYHVMPGKKVTIQLDVRHDLTLLENQKTPPFRFQWLDAKRAPIGLTISIPVQNTKEWQTCTTEGIAPEGAAFVQVLYGFDQPDICDDHFLDIRKPIIKGEGIAPAESLKPNFHKLVLKASDVSGNTSTQEFFLLIDKPIEKNIVTIRKDGAILIDGKPFFPIGLYAVWKRAFNNNSFDEAFAGLRKGGFNLAHTYSSARGPDFCEFMDAAARHNVKLFIASGKGANCMDIESYLRDVINERHHPALLSWYLADDTASHVGYESLRQLHEAIHSIDNAHITVQADGVGTLVNSRYRNYLHSTDGFLPEIYPVRKGATDDETVPRVIEDMKTSQADLAFHGNPKKTIWPIIQYFQGWSAWIRFPTYDELRAMSFEAIIHGGNGITWYTYGGWGNNHGCNDNPEVWGNMCKVATQLHDLEDVFLTECDEKAPAPVIVKGPAKDKLGFDSISVLFKRVGDRQFLICANSAFHEVTATLKATGVTKGKVWFEDRTVTLKDSQFTEVFKPYDVHVYELMK